MTTPRGPVPFKPGKQKSIPSNWTALKTRNNNSTALNPKPKATPLIPASKVDKLILKENIPHFPGISETRASFQKPSLLTEKITKPKVNFKPNAYGPGNLYPHNLEAMSKDERVKYLRSKILSGEHVTHKEISSVVRLSTKNKTRSNIENLSRSRGVSSPDRTLIFVRKGIMCIPMGHMKPPFENTLGGPDELRVSFSGNETIETENRYRFFIDLAHFRDEDLDFYLKGNKRIIIEANRPRRDEIPAKKCTEKIDLPNNLEADNLRVVRDTFGMVILEEAWKF